MACHSNVNNVRNSSTEIFNHESKFQRNFPAFSFTIIPINKLMFNEYV